jgi:hypothetical protein
MKLNKELLNDCQEVIGGTDEFGSCWNAKGLYNSMQKDSDLARRRLETGILASNRKP